MKYVSTRGSGDRLSFSEAVLMGLARDGGLFVPGEMPKIDPERIRSMVSSSSPFSAVAAEVIRPFVAGDPIERDLDVIAKEAFDFPVTLRMMEGSPKHAVLELFHGPTMAFKDFGARFLACCMSRLAVKGGTRKTILVATSGDTGSAVGSAFLDKDGIDVRILFPSGLVSDFQKAQLCSFYGNVKTLEVKGTFDDCQKMVKDAFSDTALRAKYDFSSANSINIGRLIPQMTYYWYAATLYRLKTGRIPSFVVPTGNAGNVCACFYAKLTGAPIDSIFMSCNKNHSIRDCLMTGKFVPHETVKTLANAMDVGNPSNMERLLRIFPDKDSFSAVADAECVTDNEIKSAIAGHYAAENTLICPHTACSVSSMERHFANAPAIAVATASPSKFRDVVKAAAGVFPPEASVPWRSSGLEYVTIEKGYENIFRALP